MRWSVQIGDRLPVCHKQCSVELQHDCMSVWTTRNSIVTVGKLPGQYKENHLIMYIYNKYIYNYVLS